MADVMQTGQCETSTPNYQRLLHDIGWAVKQMWNGQAVTRRGWNGRGMFVKLQTRDSGSANTLPYIWIKTAQGDRVPWIASQSDMLAVDWEFAEVI